MSWKRALENGVDLCVNEGQKLSKYRVNLAKGKKEEKSIFDRIWFSSKTAVLECTSMFSGIISHVSDNGEA